MLQIVPLKPEYVFAVIEKDPSSAFLKKFLTPAVLKGLENDPTAHCLLKDGEPIMIAGVQVFYPGRGEAWAVIDQNCTESFLAIHKKVKAYLEKHPLNRIEAAVRLDYPEGHRWLQLLGFELEAAVCRSFGIDGKDYALYARVRS